MSEYIGGATDRIQTSIWYQKAADQGDEAAIAKVAELKTVQKLVA